MVCCLRDLWIIVPCMTSANANPSCLRSHHQRWPWVLPYAKRQLLPFIYFFEVILGTICGGTALPSSQSRGALQRRSRLWQHGWGWVCGCRAVLTEDSKLFQSLLESGFFFTFGSWTKPTDTKHHSLECYSWSIYQRLLEMNIAHCPECFSCLKPGELDIIYFPYHFLTKPYSAQDLIISSYNNNQIFSIILHSSIAATNILFAFRAAAAHGVESFRNIFYELLNLRYNLRTAAPVSFYSTSHLDRGIDCFGKHCPMRSYVV